MVGDQTGMQSEGDDDGEIFAYFKLDGKRFDAPGMPVESIREVEYFRAAILEVARNLWLDANPDRSRVPNGFLDGFDLRLTRVLPGSARPQLQLHRPTSRVNDQEWAEWESVYANARDYVTGAVSALETTGHLPANFPRPANKALRKIGHTLEDDEAITFGSPDPSTPRARLDREVREILEEIDRVAPADAQSVTLDGIVIEYDGAGRSFRLRTDHGVSTCKLELFSPELANRARSLLALDGVTGPDVRVEGETQDAEQRPVQLFNVHTIDVVRSIEEKIVVSRLADLASLDRDWLGPGSEAPTAELISQVEHLAPTIASLGLQVAIVANDAGAVVLEWRRGNVEMSAAVEANGELFLCADNTVTDEIREVQVKYDESLLRRFLEEGAMQ